VLNDELDHRVAEVTEGVRHISLCRCFAVGELVASMMPSDDERSGPVDPIPVMGRSFEIVDQVSLLKDSVWSSEGSHQIIDS